MITKNKDLTPSLTLAVNGSTLLAGTDQGVFRIDPASPAVEAVGSGLRDETRIEVLLYDAGSGVLYAGGTGGLFRIEWRP